MIPFSCFRATECSKFVGSLFSEKLWPEHGVKLHVHHIGAHFFILGVRKMGMTQKLLDQIGLNFRDGSFNEYGTFNDKMKPIQDQRAWATRFFGVERP